MRAPFIVFEGADGAGTTTQAQRLAARLRTMGLVVERTAEPTDSPIGQLLRHCLRGQMGPLSWRPLAHLFAADRGWHVEHAIRPALERGIPVVCDRFHLSTVVYQGLAEGGDRVRMRALAREVRAGVPPEDEAPWWVEPDVVFVLDGPAEVFWQRVLARGGRLQQFEEQAFHRQVVEAYHSFAWDLELDSGRVRMIDGTQAPEAVEQACWGDVQQHFYAEAQAQWKPSRVKHWRPGPGAADRAAWMAEVQAEAARGGLDAATAAALLEVVEKVLPLLRTPAVDPRKIMTVMPPPEAGPEDEALTDANKEGSAL